LTRHEQECWCWLRKQLEAELGIRAFKRRRKPPLSARALEVYAYIRECVQAGAAPSVRQISKHFGWSAHNASQRHITSLVQAGLLARQPAEVRNLRLTGDSRDSV
jgi:SOS-response transcriptional repressor LexA